jgi:hypothetical protein
VLRLRKIVVTYRLQAPEARREAAERALAHHVRHCPNARSVAASIEIVTEMDFVPVAEPAAAPA